MTDDEPVAQVLERWRGERVFLTSFAGNNGDRLIEMGSRLALARAGVGTTASPRDAAAIVLNGGGGITPWHRGADWLVRLATSNPDIPLVVLPSTFRFVDPAPIVDALAGRRAPTVLFAREEASSAHLLDCGFERVAHVGLDHDMALGLRHSDFIGGLRSVAVNEHLLIVERTDVEGFTGLSDRWSFLEREQPRLVRQSVPAPLRRLVWSALAAGRRLAFQRGLIGSRMTPFVRDMRARILVDWPDFVALPVIAADISQASLCSFESFCRLISRPAAVATNRLHVAVLAAMLGKPTYLVARADSKARAVYEYSLAAIANVSFVEWVAA